MSTTLVVIVASIAAGIIVSTPNRHVDPKRVGGLERVLGRELAW